MSISKKNLQPVFSAPRVNHHHNNARWQGVVACLALMGLGLPSADAAFRKNASLTVEAEQNSNVDLTAQDEVTNQSYRLGGQLALTQDSARFATDLNLSVAREFNSDREDRTLPTGTLNSRWTISPRRLFWVLNDTVSQVLTDTLSASTIEDSSTTNTLSTGPDWVIPFTAFTSLRFSGRYERVDYENQTQSDRKRNNASVSLSHVVNSSWSTDISRTANWESFSQADLKIITDQVGLAYRGKRLNWRASVGESDLEDGRVTTDTSSFNFRYRIGSNISLVGAYSKSLDSDIGRANALAFQRAGDLFFLSGECARTTASSGGGPCENLPGVSVEVVDDEATYRQDRDPSQPLQQVELATNFLNDFQIDDALFETERYSGGLQFSLNRLRFALNYSETEERQSIDLQSVALLDQPEVIFTTTVSASLSFPVTARLKSCISFERRSPEREGVVINDSLAEDRISWELRWAVEPMLQSFFRVVHTEAVREDRDLNDQLIGELEADGLRYMIGFKYNFQ